jgi:hypothetical protein
MRCAIVVGMTRLMGDATHDNVNTLAGVSGLQLVAGYVTGSPDVRWTESDFARFPGIPHVEIDQGFTGAPVYSATVQDVEAGAWSPNSVPNWQAHCTAPRPTVYCNQSTLPAVLATGWRGNLWLAVPGWREGQALPSPPGCTIVAVQNQLDVHTAYDLSTVLDPTWPSLAPVPAPEAEMIATAAYSDGRLFAALTGTDNNVYATEQSSPGSGWTGIGSPAGGTSPVSGALSLAVEMVADTPSLFVQSADPASTGDGDVFTSWKLPDGTWSSWTKIS